MRLHEARATARRALHEGRDGEDWKKILRTMKGSLFPELLRDVAQDTGLSPARVRKLIQKWGADRRTVRFLGGRIEYWPPTTTSWAQATPGIVGHAPGTAGREPAKVALVRGR